jgi:glycosyltransferase involved in cell wall biosynthesis
MRAAWGIPHDALVFGTIGRFEPQKAFDVALQLFRQLVDSDSQRDIRLVLIGKGAMYEKIRCLVSEANLEKKVLLLDFTDRPWEAYSAFDVFIMPSKYEGLPFALLEAMACGCAPIAMGVGGIPEVLTHQELGWLVQPGDNQGFIAAMRDAANIGPGKLDEIGRRARDHIVLNFNAMRQYSKIAELTEMAAQL